MELAAAAKGQLLVERFWLCDACSKETTIIWDGARAKVVRLPQNPIPNGKPLSPTPGDASMQDRLAQDKLNQDKLNQDKLNQVRLTQDKSAQDRPNKQTPRETLLQTKLAPTRLRAAFAGRRPR
jgi:hypothetical protein